MNLWQPWQRMVNPEFDLEDHWELKCPSQRVLIIKPHCFLSPLSCNMIRFPLASFTCFHRWAVLSETTAAPQTPKVKGERLRLTPCCCWTAGTRNSAAISHDALCIRSEEPTVEMVR